MKRKFRGNLILLVLLFSFFDVIGIHQLTETGKLQRLNKRTITEQGFRDHSVGEELLQYISGREHAGTEIGLALLETKFGYQKASRPYVEQSFKKWKQKWSERQAWDTYNTACSAIWDDVKYFPIPESSSDPDITVSYIDSWMMERNYGGKRGHEGTDIMAGKNVRGLYPVVSMTDGVVESKGWLEKGGYRLGIRAPKGAYFYYAHLDSYADTKEGDTVKAGDILGFMGDSGYGKEGTTGKFDVHLHLGIYLYPEGVETSINPYWVLRYAEGKKLSCRYS